MAVRRQDGDAAVDIIGADIRKGHRFSDFNHAVRYEVGGKAGSDAIDIMAAERAGELKGELFQCVEVRADDTFRLERDETGRAAGQGIEADICLKTSPRPTLRSSNRTISAVAGLIPAAPIFSRAICLL